MLKFKRPWERGGVKALPHLRGTRVNVLVRDYLTSSRYRELSTATKRQYMSALNMFELIILPSNLNLLQELAHRVDYGMSDYIKKVLSFNLKPATVGFYFSLLSSIWENGIRNGKVIINPWSKAKIKINNVRDVTWTTQQIDIAVDTAKSLGYDLLALYIQIAYASAQRPWRDLRDLKWSNIKIHSDGSKYMDFIISKTSTHLMLPISSEVSQLLDSLPKVSDYIFTTKQGQRLTSAALGLQFNKVKRYAKLDSNLLIRDLRRTAITEMCMAGATTQEITAATGWRCTDDVIKRYAVLRRETARNCLNKRTQFQEEQKQQEINDEVRAIDTNHAVSLDV